MNDFIALIMIIVVYFLPYFFIFTLIKLSAGSLGKIQAGLDKASQKTKDFGPIKNLRENAQKSAEYRRKQVGAENAATEIPSGKNPFTKGNAWLKRTRGRVALGTAGATGGYKMIVRGEESQAAMKNSQIQMNEILKGKDGDQQASLLNEILNSGKTVGDTIVLSSGQKLRISEELQRTAIKQSVTLGEVGILDRFKNNSSIPNNNSVFQTAMTEDGLFGSVDSIAPYLTRTAAGSGKTAADQMSKSIEYYGSLKTGDTFLPPNTPGKVAKFQQEKDVTDELRRLANAQGVPPDRRDYVATVINQFSKREDLGKLDAEKVRLMETVLGDVSKRVIQSGGNLRVEYDAATDSFVAVDSSTS